MPLPLSELLPDSYFFPELKREVISFLASQPAPSNVRRDWLFLWALWVGQRINAADYRKAQEGAYDP